MKILSTGDIHITTARTSVSTRRRIEYVQSLFDDIADIYADVLIINGDLIDEKHDPGMGCIFALYNILESYRKKCQDQIIYWNVGNHDRFLVPLLKMFGARFDMIITDGVNTVVDEENNVAIVIMSYDCAMSGHTLPVYNNSKQYLYTHVPAKEGRPSLEQKINVDFSIAQLEPNRWEFIFLSDYHNHQFLRDNVMYMGAPFPLCFGDSVNPGVWLLDTENETLDCIELKSFYPRFQVYQNHGEYTPIRGYDARNYNRIHCPSYLASRYSAAYPEAEIIPSYDKVSTSTARINFKACANQEERVKTFVEVTKPDERFNLDKSRLQTMGIDYVRRANNV